MFSNGFVLTINSGKPTLQRNTIIQINDLIHNKHVLFMNGLEANMGGFGSGSVDRAGHPLMIDL